MIRTANPALANEPFGPAQTWEDLERQGRAVPIAAERERATTMTVGGTINRIAVLLALTVATAIFSWNLVLDYDPTIGGFVQAPSAPVSPNLVMIGGMIAGLILALITVFKRSAAPITAPLYALAEGCFVGGVSAVFALYAGQQQNGVLAANSGMVMQAILLTFGVLAAMLIAYRTKIIRPTRRFYMGVAVATGGVMLTYLVSFGLSFFGMSVPFIHSSGPIGIAFSLAVIAIAALNLILDFDLIATGVANRAPRYMEWYAGFAILVTLVWLYLEILRLLAKLQRR